MRERRVAKRGHVDGESLLYHYLQKELLNDDIWLFQMLTARLVTALGVWFHPDVFRRLPVMLPHVVRDASARKRAGGTEEWADPNAAGLLRDDNSLVKEAVKSLAFASARPLFDGKCIGRGSGWVAAHVWQLTKDEKRTNLDPLLNSFLPNLVWLPRELAKLSDRPGSFVQQYLQAVAAHLYRDATLRSPLDSLVEEAWAKLQIPEIPKQGLPDPAKLNFFALDERWMGRQYAKIERVLASLESVAQGGRPEAALEPSRYRVGVSRLDPAKTLNLRRFLRMYVAGLCASAPE